MHAMSTAAVDKQPDLNITFRLRIVSNIHDFVRFSPSDAAAVVDRGARWSIEEATELIIYAESANTSTSGALLLEWPTCIVDNDVEF